MPRVLKRGHFRFADRLHGGVEFTGPELRLPPHPDLAIEHFSYRSIEQYVEKFNRYTSTEAGYLAEQGQPRDWTVGVRAMMRDLWLYYEHNQGFLDGEHGWILSWLAGQYRWFSHAKMLDVGGARSGGPAEAGTPTTFAERKATMATVPPSLDAVLEVMRGELDSLRAERPQLPLGIVWRSPVWDPSGYADDSRAMLMSLACGERAVAAEEIHWSDAACSLPADETALLRSLLRAKRPLFSATITSCIPTLCQPDPRASLDILRTTFETDRIPEFWLPVLDRFDEVWVFSQHDRAAFYRSGVPPEKLRVLPSFVDTARFTPRGKKIPLPKALKGRFVFLSVFDWQLRKGWDLLLSVYCGEFSPDDGVGLLLKVTTAHGHSAEVVRRQADQVLAPLGQSLQKRPDIVL